MTARTLEGVAVAQLADALLEAAASRRPIEPLTDLHPGMTPADAYAVQEIVARRRRETGETVVGWKLGLTSAAMQQQLGVDQPDYGPLLSGHVAAPDVELRASEFIAPRVEAEIAFHLRAPLRGPGVTADDVRDATESVSASIELIDSRIAGWRIKLADTIADMASSARIIVSDRRLPIDTVDVVAESVRVEKNGEAVSEGRGAAVLGDPAAAVAWAANTLGQLGVTLEAGHVVMPGAMHASVPVGPGDTVTAVFHTLGAVSVRFVQEVP
jgi:2-keto-4-pentenoate hydratase